VATSSFIAPSTALDRRQLGKYEVLCRLSTGGMSAIYLAHQTGLAGFRKLVVLKTILPDIEGEEDFVGMFLEEARITAVFNHPNIAQVFELDTDEGQLFMAMEFVQGCTLVEMARACRQAREAIPLGLTLASVRDTALALHYAHTFTDARGRRQIVIHRDVAEKNIMVTYEGVTKLLDFGIAKALGRSGRTSIGMVKGTSGYMSPEQIRGEPLDPRSDIFSLGVVMHECLTGLRLFHGKTAEEGMMAALREDVQPPSKWNPQVTPELDQVVLKALQRDRDKRFSTALEFARAIEKAAPGAIWHPEQIGEVVTRFFAERRAETRRLLESAEFGAENTGEVKVQNVLAKVRASAEPKVPEPIKPVDTPRKQSLLTAPKVSMPNEDDGETRPGVGPGELEMTPAQGSSLPSPGLSRSEVGTSPARPKVLKPAPAPAPMGPPSAPGRGPGPGEITGVLEPLPPRARPPDAHEATGVIGPPPRLSSASAPPAEPVLSRNVVLTPGGFDEDDDAGDKTIPAAALPEEIKNLRAQFAAKKQSLPATPVAPPPSRRDEPASVMSGALAAAAASTEPSGNRLLPDKATDPARPVAPRSITGETLSITGKGEAMSWDDDDGAKTAIAAPGEVAAEIRKIHRQSKANIAAQQASKSKPEGELPPIDGGRGRAALIVTLVVLALLAVLGVLVLLEVVPLPGAKPAVGALVAPVLR
jgi:serine/threonine protein kinase